MTRVTPFDLGRSPWPEVKLDQETFATWLSRRELSLSSADPARLPDLFIACAAALDAPGAREAFERSFTPSLRTAIARVPNAPDPDDVLQRVRVRLFTKTDQRGAKLDDYRGDGTLSAWLRTMAVRQAMAQRPTHGRDEFSPRVLAALVDALPNPEVRALERESALLLKNALAKAIEDLEPRQRTWLRLSLIEGLSIDQLAPMYGVHRTTAARWLTATRERLAALTLQHIKASAKMNTGELKSLLGQVQGHLDVSLERLLRPSKG